MSQDLVEELILRWKEDPGGTYRTWFLWDQRLKNFRSIRRGVAQVVGEIEAGTFGNVYKGSSLETVVGSIAEQRQLFKGADHAFLWKPKLRIPDIYESPENQAAFGAFLNACACCDSEERVLAAIRQLDLRQIKGLGPAAANVLYFLHPTLVPPSNTAIVNGYNALTGARVKLGRWSEYLAMRSGILRLNARYRRHLSNDLGAIAGLLFDLGSERWRAPPREDDPQAVATWEADLAQARADDAKWQQKIEQGKGEDRTHTEVQGWLRDLGLALGFDVWIASNDRSRTHGDGLLGDGCVAALPAAFAAAADTIPLIDVLWLEQGSGRVSAGFEVEHTTSIYSGILRLLDLARSAPDGAVRHLFLVAPDEREDAVRAQLLRPAFRGITDLHVRWLPYGELATHREAMARFGQGIKAVEAIARSLA